MDEPSETLETSEDRFRIVKGRVLEHPRIAGTYILDCASLPADANEDMFLRNFAARHGFVEPDIGNEEWMHAEVSREVAHQELVQRLIGGAEIGHSRWDVPPADAAAIAESFLSIFNEQARFFCSRNSTDSAMSLGPYGRPDSFDYIFGGGCLAIDKSLAAVIWTLDND